MNATYWRNYFANNRIDRPEPDWELPFPEDARTAALLAKSLSHFQLGESGGGAFLLRAANERYPDEPAYGEALGMFIAEEQEHARLLSRLVERFRGKLIQSHWTHALFRMFRRALGVRFELQVLVTAELVGTAYYRMLERRVRDRVVEQVCALVLRDEASHIQFHLERFQADQERWLPMERAGWSVQFQLLFLAAAYVAWMDHRPALEAVGGSAREFFGEARKEALRFLSAVQMPRGEARPALS